MPDNKPTDSEIIKALECCGKLHIEHKDSFCNGCIFKGKAMCIGYLCDNAIGLINRLTTERNNLAHNNATLIRESITMQDLMKNQKAKTYKEVLDIIVQVYNKHIFGNNDLEAEEKDAIINFSDDITYKLNNLLKEMVGGDNA